jgi:quercetin dioxygenase-like cupin family protein
MKKLVASLAAGLLVAAGSAASAQDVMKYGLDHWKALDENEQVRVLWYGADTGAKTPVHSHPASVLYVVKGGKVRITGPDGRAEDREYPTGAAFIRPAETHADEALDDVEIVIVELKK